MSLYSLHGPLRFFKPLRVARHLVTLKEDVGEGPSHVMLPERVIQHLARRPINTPGKIIVQLSANANRGVREIEKHLAQLGVVRPIENGFADHEGVRNRVEAILRTRRSRRGDHIADRVHRRDVIITNVLLQRFLELLGSQVGKHPVERDQRSEDLGFRLQVITVLVPVIYVREKVLPAVERPRPTFGPLDVTDLVTGDRRPVRVLPSVLQTHESLF